MAREPGDDKKSGQSSRDQRLKAALRENLRRRKAQARGRAGTAKSEPPEPLSDEKGKNGPDGR